jgi:hypothetical protein
MTESTGRIRSSADLLRFIVLFSALYVGFGVGSASAQIGHEDPRDRGACGEAAAIRRSERHGEQRDYARLRTYVEGLIYKWQEANVQASGSNPDTAVNRLIAEREEIEQQILELQVR